MEGLLNRGWDPSPAAAEPRCVHDWIVPVQYQPSRIVPAASGGDSISQSAATIVIQSFYSAAKLA